MGRLYPCLCVFGVQQRQLEADEVVHAVSIHRERVAGPAVGGRNGEIYDGET